MLTVADRDALAGLAPLLRRAVGLDPRSLARFRLGGAVATGLVRLPFDVLVSRTVHVTPRDDTVDVAVRAADTIAWLDGETTEPPAPHDAEWRTGLPPAGGWRRLESVPDSVVRPLVRSGAQTLADAAAREGVPGARPRSEVADALLDSTVLTVTDDAGVSADVSLRALSALTRMDFLPRGGRIFVDTAGRWVRVVAEYGTVYLERPGSGLLLR
ncbi:MAG TPA: hypothetical protein VGN18_10840 [Jatrophihabitans sp.]|uniref:hypothetical protein n=1 Tax=Jatrophihabitans sp. TaxID=1932789 RepID=UPI002E04C243|nr:hypothetical protein [Jatrophihabitans sp.]